MKEIFPLESDSTRMMYHKVNLGPAGEAFMLFSNILKPTEMRAALLV